jgi:hypothetical protein
VSGAPGYWAENALLGRRANLSSQAHLLADVVLLASLKLP